MNALPPVHQIKLPGRAHRYRLTQAYIYEWEHEGAHHRLTIPEGFDHDAASIPRIFWPLISPLDLGDAGVVIHDWMYRFAGAVPHWSHQILGVDGWRDVAAVWPRREVERLFGRVMREDGVPRWRRRAAFRAVWHFGGGPWKRKRVQLFQEAAT